MRSPVSRCASGKGNAIKGPEFDPSELTFVSALDTEFGASHKPVCGQLVKRSSGWSVTPRSPRSGTTLLVETELSEAIPNAMVLRTKFAAVAVKVFDNPIPAPEAEPFRSSRLQQSSCHPR
jgi:hypothetical protein